MAENERKNEIIGANYAWNIRSPVNLCKPWLNLVSNFRIRIPGKVKIFMPPTQQYFQTLHRNDVLRGSSRVPAPRPNLHAITPSH